MIVLVKRYDVTREQDSFIVDSFERAPGRISTTVEITLVGECTDEDLRMLQSARTLELLPAQPRKPASPPGDDERVRRLEAEDEPNWSGCPDCGALPCACDVDMF